MARFDFASGVSAMRLVALRQATAVIPRAPERSGPRAALESSKGGPRVARNGLACGTTGPDVADTPSRHPLGHCKQRPA